MKNPLSSSPQILAANQSKKNQLSKRENVERLQLCHERKSPPQNAVDNREWLSKCSQSLLSERAIIKETTPKTQMVDFK